MVCQFGSSSTGLLTLVYLFFIYCSLRFLPDIVHECLVLDQRPNAMRRVQRRDKPTLDFCISSPDEDDSGNAVMAISNTDSTMVRLSLLPAFPSLHGHGAPVYRDRDHLLLANVPRAYFLLLLPSGQ